MEVAHPDSGSSSTCFLVELEFGNVGFLIFEETKKPEYPEKSLSEQRIEPATNSTHIWRHRRDLNPGHIGGGRALSPLRHPLLSVSHISIKIQPSMVHSDWLSYY